METLYFRVQGSRGNSYKVTFEGDGETLQAFCTCPAGTQRGQFCKHIAAVLKGETRAIIEGVEQISDLQKRAQGSSLMAKAKTHKASPPKAQLIDLGDMKSISDIAAYLAEKLKETEFWCEHTQGDNDQEMVGVYIRKLTKSGKPSKKATLLLSIKYDPYMRDSAWDADEGVWIYGELRKKAMPWIVNGTNYGRFETAASRFLTELNMRIDESKLMSK